MWLVTSEGGQDHWDLEIHSLNRRPQWTKAKKIIFGLLPVVLYRQNFSLLPVRSSSSTAVIYPCKLGNKSSTRYAQIMKVLQLGNYIKKSTVSVLNKDKGMPVRKIFFFPSPYFMDPVGDPRNCKNNLHDIVKDIWVKMPTIGQQLRKRKEPNCTSISKIRDKQRLVYWLGWRSPK